MTNQESPNKMNLRERRTFTPEQELALEQIIKKCLHFMEANVLRKTAIQNIRNKIAAIENAELTSDTKKKRGCKKLVLSFQNSMGCSVRMSEGFSKLSQKPIPIISKKRRKKKKALKPVSPRHAETTVISLQEPSSSLNNSNNFNTFLAPPSPFKNIGRKEKALKSISPTHAKKTVISLRNSTSSSRKNNNCNSFPKNLLNIKNLHKKQEETKPEIPTLIKTTVISLQSSSSLLKKSDNCDAASENSPIVLNLTQNKKDLEPMRPSRIKTSVKKYVPEDSRIIFRTQERKRRWKKYFQMENNNRNQ